MKKFLILAIFIATTACGETVKGMGQDMEHLGKKMQGENVSAGQPSQRQQPVYNQDPYQGEQPAAAPQQHHQGSSY